MFLNMIFYKSHSKLTLVHIQNIDEIREKIAQWMETSLDDATDPWGVKVERVEM